MGSATALLCDLRSVSALSGLQFSHLENAELGEALSKPLLSSDSPVSEVLEFTLAA